MDNDNKIKHSYCNDYYVTAMETVKEIYNFPIG